MAPIIVPEDLPSLRIDDDGFDRSGTDIESSDNWSVHLSSNRKRKNDGLLAANTAPVSSRALLDHVKNRDMRFREFDSRQAGSAPSV
jgi:hypothetical protein